MCISSRTSPKLGLVLTLCEIDSGVLLLPILAHETYGLISHLKDKKYLAQGQYHYWDLNPHSADQKHQSLNLYELWVRFRLSKFVCAKSAQPVLIQNIMTLSPKPIQLVLLSKTEIYSDQTRVDPYLFGSA